MEKLELVVQALQQRIGEIVSQYETHIAVLRAEITPTAEENKSKETLNNELGDKFLNYIESMYCLFKKMLIYDINENIFRITR